MPRDDSALTPRVCCPPRAPSQVVTLSHSLGLRSAYASTVRVGDRQYPTEPVYTSYHGNAGIAVDYVWVSGGIQALGVWEMLPCEALETPHSTIGNGCKGFAGLPSKDWGSDHMALVCRLRMRGMALE